MFVISGKAIGKMLQMNNALQTLKLGWNNLYLEECIVPLLKGLVKNQAVKLMDLSWNGLSGELFAKTCRAVFRKNRVLEEINLEFNRLKFFYFVCVCDELTTNYRHPLLESPGPN